MNLVLRQLMTLVPRQFKLILVKVLAAIYLSLVIYSLANYNPRCRINMPHMIDNEQWIRTSDTGRCRIHLRSLGRKKVDIFSEPKLDSLIEENEEVKNGGWWKPSGCRAWQRVAIIIPYRDRWKHLKILLKRLHPMLKRQQVHYRIFVIEQAGPSTFNRGKLMNVGYLEALNYNLFDCFVFHDVDLIPENDQNIYMCDQHARHLSSAIDEMRYHVMFYNYAGGVIALNRENVKKINGYSNLYWGWGNEDDDLSARTRDAGLLLTRPPEYIGRYKMVRHVKNSRAEHGNELFLSWRDRWPHDGLNDSLGMNYTLISRSDLPLYTNITVDVGSSRLGGDRQGGKFKESLWWFLNFYYP